MRVLLVSDYPPGPTGGAEVQVGRLADALRAAGCAVEVFTGDGSHTGWRRVLDIWDPSARTRIRERIAAFGPDVVHYHNVINELSTSVLGVGPPSVLTVHDPRILGDRFGADQDRHPLLPTVAARTAKNRFARRRLRTNVAATIAPNPTLVDGLRDAGFPDVRHIEYLTPVIPSGPPGCDVVFAGTIAEHKGPHVLLDAWRQIEAGHPQSRLRILGGGPMFSHLDDRVRRYDLGERVELVGQVAPDDVVGELVGAAVVAVPSLGTENQPMAVLEALAVGRPVVASSWPGAETTVDDQVGVLVPPGDVGALAGALDRILGDAPARRRMGEAALARATERWSPDAQVDRFLDVYSSVGA